MKYDVSEVVVIALKSIAPVSYLIFEYWLGRTKKVKANSTIELVWLIVESVSKCKNKK